MQANERRKPLTESEYFAALNRISTALLSEYNEQQLLQLIAQTAVDVTGARFAAFSLRPINEQGDLLVPSEGNLFHLAAVVGVTKEQEELFRRTPLGGEGVLAPIFRYGVPVRVADVMAHVTAEKTDMTDPTREQRQASARDAASAYAHGKHSSEQLQSLGIPVGHPTIRSFLGVPLLDHTRQVRGGLLLGDTEPNRFGPDEEALLIGLATQAAIAIDNMRLYQAMQTRAQELGAIFQNIADGITLFDPQCHILRENIQAQHLRYQLEQSSLGREHLQTLLYTPARLALHGQSQRDITITRVNEKQERFAYLINATPLYQANEQPSSQQASGDAEFARDHIITGAVVIWHDITEARRIHEERLMYAEIEARNTLLQRVLDELPTSVYLVQGPDARLVLANQASRYVWGASWPQGQPMLQFLQENQIQIFRTDGRILQPEQLATLRAVQRGESIYQHQEIIRHADGSSLPVQVNAIPLDTRKGPLNLVASRENGQEAIALVVHQDVSALKEAEYLKDDFIGIAAHELRTPLTALQGFLELFQIQLSSQPEMALTPEQDESLQNVYQASQRMVELTNDLLDVTRLQGGRLELHQEITDLVSLVKRVLKRYQITTTHHQFTLSAPAPFMVVSIDVMRIEQVLTNLISNAIKYSPTGGEICISLEVKAGPHPQAQLSIKDSGIGIPISQQARIFSRFTRADNAQAQGIYGTGLGLYLSRELVERHGGSIWFQSRENQGTTFFVTLPLAARLIEDESVQ